MKRKSGVLLPIFSLGGGHSIGSFGSDAYRFIDKLAEGGFSLWQILPLGATDRWGSPYSSASSFSLNPYFVDLQQLFEEGLLTREELSSAKESTPYRCEYARLSKERLKLLFSAAARFRDKEAVKAFIEEHPYVGEFCRFMTLKEVNGGAPHWEWRETVLPDERLFAWQFIEYKAYHQWQALHAYASSRGVSILGDLSMYPSLDSADVYFHSEEFLLDEKGRPLSVAGVPPDAFAPEGQKWGNPLYRWKKASKEGYAFFKERLSFACSLFDGVRLDHFRALESYFAIPVDQSAREGRWIKGPGNGLLRALADLTEGADVIAEDLGFITPAVERLVKRSGFATTRVLQFGFSGEGENPHLPHRYPENAAVYTGTHDNNTLLGYLYELKEEDRGRILSYCNAEGKRPSEAIEPIVKTLLASRARLAIFPLQDLLGYGGDARINTPGRAEDNWHFRLSSEDISAFDLSRFLPLNRLYGRI